jgi:NADPH:quinone reductase-like Zn-dependent oxidoreductase
MKAVVLYELGLVPRFGDFPEPVPIEGEVLLNVKATALNNISKSRARGTHYDSYRQLPAVCGVDGVGVAQDGTRVFFGGCRPPYGTMAERTVAPKAWCGPVPSGVDDLTAAALPNAALSSWLPLVYRTQLQQGETVLILGATGVAGKLAIQVAKQLGASRVVAAGRNEKILQTLPNLGADALISLSQSDEGLAEVFAQEASKHPFNVILDYVWGHPTEVLMAALIRHDLMAEESRIRFVSIGSLAGPMASIPSAALRSSGLELYGSGGGSVSHQAIAETFPHLWALASSGKLKIDVVPVTLAEAEEVWNRQDTEGRRFVFVP